MHTQHDDQSSQTDAMPERENQLWPAKDSNGSKEQRVYRVLVVDDEANIRSSLCRLFRKEPYEIVTADSGDQALAEMENTPAQLVITDQRMPGITGIELLHEIRNRWPETIRIVLSGYSEVSALISAINEGDIYKFISKPWNDEEMRLHVQRALEQYELEYENRRLALEIIEHNIQLKQMNNLLDQRVRDTKCGLNFAQDLIEWIDAGVIAVDDQGLIVFVNKQAIDMLASERQGLIGMSAHRVLPSSITQQLGRTRYGMIQEPDMLIHWRTSPLPEEQAESRGAVVTLWRAAA